MRPQDRLHRSPRFADRADAGLDRPPMLLRHLGQHARVRLVCGACGWSKTYDPYRLAQRLAETGAGGPNTAIAHVARHVQRPCPRCAKTTWTAQPERPTSPKGGGGPPAEERVVEGAGHRQNARPNRDVITKRARELRKQMSEPEVMLWARLRRHPPGRPKFRRQHPIGTVIVDFFCPAVRLALEVDGRTHWDDEARARDAARDRSLMQQGVHVMRFEAGEIYRDLTGVVDAIMRRAEALRTPSSGMRPAPSTTPSAGRGPPPSLREVGEAFVVGAA